jgi:transmembrane sensor
MNEPGDGELPLDRDGQAIAWCMRMAEGRLMLEEQSAFDRWLAQAGNREAFEEAVAVWHGAEIVAEQPELIRVRTQALESFRAANERRWETRASSMWRWPASVAAALLIGIVAFHFTTDAPEVYETGIGERRIAMLADGSRVSMDAATRIEVRLTDAGRKLRLLAGRAKFDVARDPLRPFSVMAGGKIVVAVGTSFSIERVRDEVRVILYEGRVEVLERSEGSEKLRPLRFDERLAPHERTLSPGRELVASLGEPDATVVPADVSRSLSWEAGQLSFVNEPLASAIERMNRYSREHLEVGDAEAAASKVNGVFTAGDVRAFAEGVTTFCPVDAIHRSGRLVFVASARKKDRRAAVLPEP